MILDEIAFRHLLSKGEEVRYVAHKHIFLVYPALFKILLLGIAMPLIGWRLFPPFYPIFMVWIGLGVLLFTYRIVQWYLDAWIVTNYGVIDQEWDSFFSKATTRIEFGNVEGISNETRGFWGTVLGYGTVQVEHMSGEPVSISNVSKPRHLERTIVKYQQEFLRQQNFSDQNKLKDLLTNLLRSTTKDV